SPVSRALNIFLCFRSWGLRPRLYAVACFAGFMLTPASQALCLRPLRRLYAYARFAGFMLTPLRRLYAYARFAGFMLTPASQALCGRLLRRLPRSFEGIQLFA